MELSSSPASECPTKHRALNSKCSHDGENVISQVICGVVPVCRCRLAGRAEALGDAIDMVLAGELRRKTVKAMRGTIPGKEDEGPSRPSPIQNLKPDTLFYRDKLHLMRRHILLRREIWTP